MSEIVFRCSSLGRLMTEPRSKSESLSETAKALCLELFIEKKYGRRKYFDSKYMVKGREVEENGITAYNVHVIKTTGEYVEINKNTERRTNDFITGEPDIITPKLADIKSSWDIFTFWDSKTKALNKDYFWQLHGYMMLFGHDEADLVYTLQNTPEEIVKREARFRVCKDNEFNFDDLPAEEKIFIINIKRDEQAIQSIADKVTMAREFISKSYGVW